MRRIEEELLPRPAGLFFILCNDQHSWPGTQLQHCFLILRTDLDSFKRRQIHRAATDLLQVGVFINLGISSARALHGTCGMMMRTQSIYRPGVILDGTASGFGRVALYRGCQSGLSRKHQVSLPYTIKRRVP